MYRDSHHILNNRVEWTARTEAKTLRDTRSLVPKIGREAVHNVIHAECPPVPLLGYHALKRTLSLFYPTADTLSTMDNLMLAIGEASNHPRAHPVEHDLAQLTIRAIDLQRPYLADYFAAQNTTVIDLGAR